MHTFLIDYGFRENVLFSNCLTDSFPEYGTTFLEGKDWILKTLVSWSSTSDQLDQGLLLMQTHSDTAKREVVIRNCRYHYSHGVLKESIKCLYDYRCQICGMKIFHYGWDANFERKQQWQYLSADAHHIIPLSK
jgi:predicted restriction endonuclease